jgi:hypothetical protein
VNHEEKLSHIRKLINAVRVFSAGMLLFIVGFVALALGAISWEAIPGWLFAVYFVVMSATSWLIMVLNCCPWCGASFLWEESMFNQITRNPLVGLGVKQCANCGMPSE